MRQPLATRRRTAFVVEASLVEHETQHAEELLALCTRPKCVLLAEIERLLSIVKARRA